MSWRGRSWRVWWRWLLRGRPRWCNGTPCTTDGLMSCGCVWDAGYMVSLCDMHEEMASRSGLVLRDGDLHRREGS